MCISLKTILGDINTFWAKLLIGFLQNIFIIGIPQITNFYDNNPSITTSKLKKKKYIYIYIQSSTKCSEINLMKRGDREQLKAIVVLFNKVRRLWLFFFFFFNLLPATWLWRWKSRGGDRERNVQRERERERESYKFFGFRNKYGMY